MHGWSSDSHGIFVVLVGYSIIVMSYKANWKWGNGAIIIEVENGNHYIKVFTTKYDQTSLKFENFSNFVGKHPAKLILSHSLCILTFPTQRLSLGMLATWRLSGPVLDTAVWEVGRETQLKLQIVRQSTVQAF